MKVVWAIENNLVYLRDYSAWVYDNDSFLGCWEITSFIFEDYSGWVYDYDSFLGFWGIT